MNREKLINAFESIATAEGYEFHSAEERYIPQHTTLYPALWLTPPTFHAMEGRNHGSITYSVKLHAMKIGAKHNPKQRNATRIELEDMLLRLFTTLSEEAFVAEVENIQICHTSQTLSSHGEIEATATAEVITLF